MWVRVITIEPCIIKFLMCQSSLKLHLRIIKLNLLYIQEFELDFSFIVLKSFIEMILICFYDWRFYLMFDAGCRNFKGIHHIRKHREKSHFKSQ